MGKSEDLLVKTLIRRSLEGRLSDRLWDSYKDGIAKKVAEDPELSYEAGCLWSEERFLPVSEIIAQGVSQDAKWSYEAGRLWKDETFNPVAEIIAQGVAKFASWSYQAGLNWNDERFEPNWWTIVQSLNEVHKPRAKGDWPGLRKFVPYFTPETSNTYFQYNEKERNVWHSLALGSFEELFINLQPPEFRTVAKAYELVNNQPKFSFFFFFYNLNKVMESGNTQQWAKHIINHHEKKPESIGGDTYRIA